MNRTPLLGLSTTALRVGATRGLVDFRNSLQKAGDVTYYIIGAAGFTAGMVFLRDQPVPELGISTASIVFPNALAIMMLFVATYGLATLVTTEREDGTVLRLSILPGGVTAYAWGQTVRTFLELVFTFALFTVLAVFLVPNLTTEGVGGVAAAVGFLLLGVLATLPLGFVIGCVFSNPRSVGGWGFLVIGALVAASGVIVPLGDSPLWVQIIGQLLPLYWLGLGLRSALLPEAFAAAEIGESWRTLESIGVLGIWAVAGIVLAPMLLQRVVRRESFAQLAQRREKALQRV